MVPIRYHCDQNCCFVEYVFANTPMDLLFAIPDMVDLIKKSSLIQNPVNVYILRVGLAPCMIQMALGKLEVKGRPNLVEMEVQVKDYPYVFEVGV